MKDRISLIYKIIIVIVSGISVYLNINAFSLNDAILYYTVQSNIMCLVFFLTIVVLTLLKKLKKNQIYYIIKGTCTMSITVTMFIYVFILSKNSSMNVYNGHEIACNLAHVVVPLLVICDYLIFGIKGNLKTSYPFIWSLTLVLYLVFDIFYVCLGGKFIDGSIYPYYYMNVEKYGYLKVGINCLMLYVFFIVYSFIVKWLDNKLAQNK